MNLSYLIAILLGLGPLIFGLWRLYKDLQPTRWLPIQGRITESRIERQYAGHGGYQSVPIIEFEYVIDGVHFSNRAVLYTTGTRSSAKAKIEQFPLGACVTAFFNPKNHSKACLEFKISPTSWLLILLGGVILIIEALLAFPFT